MKYNGTIVILIFAIILVNSCRTGPDKPGRTKGSPYGKESETTGKPANSPVTPVSQPQEPVNDIDGNVYNTIRIGTQVWLLKNLKTTHYNDGKPIPMVSDGSAWASLSTPGYCWYENEPTSFKPTYGALYNGYAVATGKLCPTGWHVPGDQDWTALTNYFGGESVAGASLKETGTSFWVSPNTGATNQSGFTALPGGLRYHDGAFHDFGFSGYWWSSTGLDRERSFFRYMDYEYANVFRFDNLNKLGFSVRCLRD